MGLMRQNTASPFVRRRVSVLTSIGLGVLLFVAGTVLIALDLRGTESDESPSPAADPAVGGVGYVAEGDLNILDRTPSVFRRLSAYPDDKLIDQPYRSAPNRYLIVVHIILIGYALLGLNTVCDVYFTGALEVMIRKWQIKPDVAGATFMAAGGSAPELFTSLIGACLTENDVGFGTIVGSAVFNVLFVIGLCGFTATEDIHLTWWPLFRDCSYYILGLALLASFSSDEEIRLWEAVLLFMIYIFYCIIMFHNTKLEVLADTWMPFQQIKRLSGSDEKTASTTVGKQNPACADSGGDKTWDAQVSEDSVETITIPNSIIPVPPTGVQSGGTGDAADSEHYKEPAILSDAGSDTKKEDKKPHVHLHGKVRASMYAGKEAAMRHDDRIQSIVNGGASPKGTGTDPERISIKSFLDDNGEEDEGDLMTMPDGGLDLWLWYFSLPIYVPLHYTIPEPEEKFNKFMLTFTMALAWIAAYSFFLVWWVEILGEILRIPTIIMGFTLLAAGTSIPDAVSSVAVARMGEGDMAVSSSIGSNIFDILIGLPIPWMLKIAVIEGGDYRIRIVSPYVAFYVMLLLCMVSAVICCIHWLGWVLNKKLGILMSMLYVVFLIVAVSVEVARPEGLKF
jgi:K+-dependent Na+/Ca+ exchanger-like protein